MSVTFLLSPNEKLRPVCIMFYLAVIHFQLYPRPRTVAYELDGHICNALFIIWKLHLVNYSHKGILVGLVATLCVIIVLVT